MRKNILLDVFNPDIRRRAGLYSSLTTEAHIGFLTRVLNAGVLLCKEHCILPPGFILLCDIARSATSLKQDFFIDRYIRLPLREDNLQELLDKKRSEYHSVRSFYQALYGGKGTKFLLSLNVALIQRRGKVGASIARLWERAPDENEKWDSLKAELSAAQVEVMRLAPKVLHEEGVANTLPALTRWISERTPIAESLIHYALQNSYGATYFDEYDLAVITHLPYVHTSFGLGINTVTHSYQALEVALRPMGLWPFLADASAEQVIHLRNTAGYFAFSELFEDRLAGAVDHRMIGRLFTYAANDRPKTIAATRREIHEFLRTPNWKRSSRTDQLVGQISLALLECSDSVSRNWGESLSGPAEATAMSTPHFLNREPKEHMLAIFVALQLEAEVLRDRWKLVSDSNGLSWSGLLNGIRVVVYSPHEMGRVPAAVSTMRFLYMCKEMRVFPKMLLTLGIAGGFQQQDVTRGDLLLANRVTDLATRKIYGGAEPRTQFRPRPWDTDTRIINHIYYANFDWRHWAFKASREEEWHYDEARYPKLHAGPVTSLDEVISSEEWVQELCSVEPKLLGVEMEAGGVCAAAASFGMKVAVIRGVSDYADPAKTDDKWRIRALKTLANLIESIPLTDILTQVDRHAST